MSDTITHYELGQNDKLIPMTSEGKENLQRGTVLHWGGNMGWAAEDFTIIKKNESSFGVSYRLIGLNSKYSSHTTQAHSLKYSTDEVWHNQHFFITDRILSESEVLTLEQKAVIAKAEREQIAKEAREQFERDTNAEIKRNPHLTPANEMPEKFKYHSAARNIRTDLKKNFPGLKFSVRSDGSAVDITWTDGATSEQVDKVVDKYQNGNFNGMEDIYEYNTTPFNAAFGGEKYIFTHREFSDKLIEQAIKTVFDCWKPEGLEMPTADNVYNSYVWIENASASFSNLVGRECAKIDAYQPPAKPKPIKTVESVNNSDITVSINEEKNGVEVRFPSIPSVEVRDSLKSHGFRWSRFSKCWYTKHTPEALAFAQSLTH